MGRTFTATLVAALALLLGVGAPASASDNLSTVSTVPESQAKDLSQTMIKKYGVGTANMYVLDEKKTKKVDGGTLYLLPAEAENSLTIAPEVARDLNLEKGKVPKHLEIKTGSALLKLDKENSRLNKVASTLNAEVVESAQGPLIEAPAQPAASCSTGFYTRPGGNWGTWTNRRCSLIGTSVGKQSYAWQHHFASQAQSCAQGVGYKKYYYYGKYKGVVKGTYGLGCGRSGGRVVPWENTAAYPQLRTKSAYLYMGGDGIWS